MTTQLDVDLAKATVKSPVLWAAIIGALTTGISVAWGIRGLYEAVERVSAIADQHGQDIRELPQLRVSIDRLRETFDSATRDRWTRADMRMWVLEVKSANPNVDLVLPPLVKREER